ncbi:MAG: SPFH domain-containing protein [Anaerolineae bacterium]|nr:SPFH domain-containing protein [Anaerolineae bacterium]
MVLEQTLYLINITLAVVVVTVTLIYVGLVARYRGWQAALKAPFRVKAFVPMLIFIFVVSFIRMGIHFLQPSEVGVVISVLAPGGYYDKAFRSGLHWTFPMLEHMDRYSFSWQVYEMSANAQAFEDAAPINGNNHINDTPIKARTSDGQEVSIECTVIYHVVPEQIMRVYIEWQSRYVQDFLRPVARGIVRTRVAQFTAEEVNSSKSLDLERDINRQLQDELNDKGFALERFIIRTITFSPEYATAVEQKQVALENALRGEHEANRVRILAQGDADATITRAKGEAEAARLRTKAETEHTELRAEAESRALAVISNTLRNNHTLLSYRYIDKLSPQLRVMMVPNNTPFFMNLPLGDLTQPITNTAPAAPTTADNPPVVSTPRRNESPTSTPTP